MSLPRKKELFVHQGIPVVMYSVPSTLESDLFYIAQIIDGRIGNLINVEVTRIPQLPGYSANRVEIWRSYEGMLSAYSKHLASRVIDRLLHDYWYVVSADIQTRDGERFWKDRLAEAWASGKPVGLIVQGEPAVRWAPPADRKEYSKWFAENDPWGKAAHYMNKRLVIAFK